MIPFCALASGLAGQEMRKQQQELQQFAKELQRHAKELHLQSKLGLDHTRHATTVQAVSDDLFNFKRQIYDSGVLHPKLPVIEEAPEPPVGALDLGEDVPLGRFGKARGWAGDWRLGMAQRPELVLPRRVSWQTVQDKLTCRALSSKGNGLHKTQSHFARFLPGLWDLNALLGKNDVFLEAAQGNVEQLVQELARASA
eukprot:s855_g34.t1